MAKSDDILAKQLWALGDLARLKILRHLPHSENCEHGNNVSQLADMLGLAQPTVSHHLRVLRQAGLVSNKKMCRDVFYWVNQAEAEVVIERLRGAMCAESAATESVPASRPHVH
jgi:ArsR family transcriptional regulator